MTICSNSMEKHQNKWLWLFPVQTGKAGDGYVANQWKKHWKKWLWLFLLQTRKSGDGYVANQWKTLKEVAMGLLSLNWKIQ